MKEDKILQMLFEPQRWQQAINKGVDKASTKQRFISSQRQKLALSYISA